jgi:hypothetical protein
MKLDIILKTWPADYGWIPYLFRSMAKYVTGYDNLILAIEEQYPAPFDLPPGAIVKRCRRYEGIDDVKPIFGVAIERLRAWDYSDADAILFVDSDCVFTRPVDLKTDPFINAERPMVYYREWSEVGPALCWHAPTLAVLGFEPPYETMYGYPDCYPRDVLVDLWKHVGGEDRLRALKNPTDLNVMGNFAIVRHPDKVTAVHVSQMVNPCVHQFWSHGGIRWPRDQADIDENKMGGGVANVQVQEELRRMGLDR